MKNLKFKEEFLGTRIIVNGRQYDISNDISDETKFYIYKMISPAMFKVQKEEIVNEEIKKEYKISNKKSEQKEND